MGQLVFEDLEISQFRGLQHLCIDQLGRVNLIVGKNNVGKTSLLEAIRLYARKGSPPLIWSILRARNEISSTVHRVSELSRNAIRHADSEDRLSLVADTEDRMRLACENLFYGRKEMAEAVKHPIRIGPVNSPDKTLSIAFNWYVEQRDSDGRRQLEPIPPGEGTTLVDLRQALTVQMGDSPKVVLPLDDDDLYFRRWASTEIATTREIRYISVPANGLQDMQVGRLWDNIALTSLEEDVLSSLRIIHPDIERLSIIGSQDSRTERIVVVKIPDLMRPVPLRSLGDGMNRILGIVLALVNVQDGILLVDEIENGIHYSVQPDLWRLIFQVAQRLNVQVFATSHSWDCIEAFQKAAQENVQEEGMLIRLERRKGEIRATLFDERKLGIATREQIEVR